MRLAASSVAMPGSRQSGRVAVRTSVRVRLVVGEDDGAHRALAVASGAASFLSQRFDRFRHRQVDRVANVRLVDAHAESRGGDQQRLAACLESPLGFRFVLGPSSIFVVGCVCWQRQSFRFAAGVDADLMEGQFGGGVGRRAGLGMPKLSAPGEDGAADVENAARSVDVGAKDNPAASAAGKHVRGDAQRVRDAVIEQAGEDVDLFVPPGRNDRELQLRPVERARPDGRLVAIDRQFALHVAQHRFRRRAGQGQNRRPVAVMRAIAGGDAAEVEIGRPEIVPPLRHAMRFVDRQVGDGPLFDRLLQQIAERLDLQPLRRDEDQPEFAPAELPFPPRPFLGRRVGVDLDRVADAGRVQVFDLVLHQALDRVDHQRQAGREQRRQLIRDRFAGSRRQQADRVLPPQRPLDDGELPFPKRFFPERELEEIDERRFMRQRIGDLSRLRPGIDPVAGLPLRRPQRHRLPRDDAVLAQRVGRVAERRVATDRDVDGQIDGGAGRQRGERFHAHPRPSLAWRELGIGKRGQVLPLDPEPNLPDADRHSVQRAEMAEGGQPVANRQLGAGNLPLDDRQRPDRLVESKRAFHQRPRQRQLRPRRRVRRQHQPRRFAQRRVGGGIARRLDVLERNRVGDDVVGDPALEGTEIVVLAPRADAPHVPAVARKQFIAIAVDG
jgi:hypothetical protein